MPKNEIAAFPKKSKKFDLQLILFSKIGHGNKASEPELQAFAKISVVDGVSNFAPKIITKKTDC